MTRVENIVWRPISEAAKYVKFGSKQIVLLYKSAYEGQFFLEYSTSNPSFVIVNAANDGYTEFAILIDADQ